MLPCSQASQRAPIRKRPPLPKQFNVQAILSGQKMQLLDLRVLAAYSNQSLQHPSKRSSEDVGCTEIFVKKSAQSKSCLRKQPILRSTIDSARESMRSRLSSLLTVQDKFEELRANLEDKQNTVVVEEKCESSRVSTSNSQRSLGRPRGKLFPMKDFSTNFVKVEAELRSKLTSKSWIVYDQQRNTVLFERGSSVKRQMASLTKIMTCLVVLDLCEDLDLDCTTFRVIVSARAASVNGTNAELTAGTEITIRDLLYGLMLPSGNDAALTLAEYFGTMLALVKESPSCQLPEDAYDPQKLCSMREQTKRCVHLFVTEMNRKAQKLGMLRTHYSNPHGLSDKNNHSTCWDITRLCDHATHHRHFMQIVTTKEFSCVCSRTLKTYKWTNTHKLLEEGWSGIKTGVTPAAGPCLSSFYKDSKGKLPVSLIIILLNCSSMDARYTETKLLLEHSLRSFE